ncbi:hypothetical protein [Heliorestis convoluta]|uniref:Putative membrane protein n=1 Tax=Heliorestis convoluta TaxID=356322 RepID=A0A5Q2N303_9FIRM|nr:hypothetical protein [Heliorestis convoluta]QGG48661.1 putative membrane protein [Heliorestis convoluta]
MLYVILLVTIASIFLAVYRKQPLFLGLPFAAIFVHMMVQIAMVPMGFFETLQFIMSLR